MASKTELYPVQSTPVAGVLKPGTVVTPPISPISTLSKTHEQTTTTTTPMRPKGKLVTKEGVPAEVKGEGEEYQEEGEGEEESMKRLYETGFYTCPECYENWKLGQVHLCWNEFLSRGGAEKEAKLKVIQEDVESSKSSAYIRYDEANMSRLKTLVLDYPTDAEYASTESSGNSKQSSAVFKSLSGQTALFLLKAKNAAYADMWSLCMNAKITQKNLGREVITPKPRLGSHVYMSWFYAGFNSLQGERLANMRGVITKHGHKMFVKSTLGAPACLRLFSEDGKTLPMVYAVDSVTSEGKRYTFYCVAPLSLTQHPSTGKPGREYKYTNTHFVDQPYLFFRLEKDSEKSKFALDLAGGREFVNLQNENTAVFTNVPLDVLKKYTFVDVCVVVGTWRDWLPRERHTDSEIAVMNYCDPSVIRNVLPQLKSAGMCKLVFKGYDETPNEERDIIYEESKAITFFMTDVLKKTKLDEPTLTYTFESNAFLEGVPRQHRSVIESFIHEFYCAFLRNISYGMNPATGQKTPGVTCPSVLTNTNTYSVNSTNERVIPVLTARTVDLGFMLRRYGLLTKKTASRLAYIFSAPMQTDNSMSMVCGKFKKMSRKEIEDLLKDRDLAHAYASILPWWFAVNGNYDNDLHCNNCYCAIRGNAQLCASCVGELQNATFCSLECLKFHKVCAH